MRFSTVLAVVFMLAACNRDLPSETIPSNMIEWGAPQAGAGLYASLAVDADGRLHAVYYHADLATLRHAVWKEGRWSIQSVAAPDDLVESGRHARLAIHGSTLYVAYQKRTFEDPARERLVQEQVWLATSNGGEAWREEPVDESSHRTGDFIALAVQQGKPVVAYLDATNQDLMLARRDGTAWAIEPIDTQGDVGRYVSIDVSIDQRLHLAYYDASHGALKYAEEQGGKFEISYVDGYAVPPTAETDERNAGTWTQIQAQPRGSASAEAIDPKIAYFDETSRTLQLAERAAGEWKLSQIDDRPYAGTDVAFLWMRDGALLVAYFDGYSLDAKLARRTQTGWSHQTVLTEGAVGMYNALADLGDGRAALATYDLSRGALHFILLPVRP